jgi:hypothetical protein
VLKLDSTAAKMTYPAKAIPIFHDPRAGIPDARSETTQTTMQVIIIAILKRKLPNHAASDMGRRYKRSNDRSYPVR